MEFEKRLNMSCQNCSDFSSENKSTGLPSIFNDVLGPVMRGPSSSHCAASVRIGRMARDLMGGKLTDVLIEFHPDGSLATTHESQGSDMGLFGGLLGWDAADERLVDSATAIKRAGINVEIKISQFEADHPNTYKLTLKNQRETHEMIALSTGGGIIEVIKIDGVEVSMAGDYFETLLYLNSENAKLVDFLNEKFVCDAVISHQKNRVNFVEIKAQHFPNEELLAQLKTKFNVRQIKKISPVLPVLSRKDLTVPFLNCTEMLLCNQDENLSLWELAVKYESARGNISKEQIFANMENIIGIMQNGIETGIRGTDFSDRILGPQSGNFQQQMQAGRLLDGGILNQIILYTTALMESKSSMQTIVAAPTAGSCGALPGACLGTADALELPMEMRIKAMLAAGIIGVFIAENATFAAEVGGCQAECGSGSAMAAAALVTLANGSCKQAIDAASMALQNTLGMICDPVANRVEVPCLGKNVIAASNALACANMALANFDAVIPLDEVIETLDKVGKMLPAGLRCTACAGLSVTRTSKKIEAELKRKVH